MRPFLPNKTEKSWLPLLVVGIGLFLSLSFWYLLWHNLPDYFRFIHSVEAYLSWIGLCFGVSISILLAVLIRVAQVAKSRAIHLIKMNEDLKNEVAERISSEETRQKLEVALLQGQKLQAIGTLAGGIAHDFNNLLYAIIGYTEMSREDVDHETLVYHNLGKVLKATHRGQELIARILAFSRRQQHQFDVINLKSSVEAALDLLRPTIPASVMIHFSAKTEVSILGNQTQIHQVLVNLINNAVDAMDGEGTISITMSEILAHDPYLKQFLETSAQNYCKIEIKDTGHGMDQATMERIFEPFYTTKEVGKGTGLGLSIVHSIIKEHLGDIKVTSQLGQGSTFTVLLPEYQAS
ncbi:MAG: hypothetical protein A3E85_01420 [Gammaproteobacteria bacterium RIFCSPHIGHO2_12_FULL_45_12]|nr:MAG: hypothetical protein A3E85_01420 [Gammaproteobacteria bacterium RIFCSPHIGHO2_12_FULL_45_12]